jgi:GT2 family glycosyltransferase
MGVGSWEGTPQGRDLLLIAIPHTGLVSFEWSVGLRILQPPVPFNIISNKGLPIDRARCDLVEQAQKMGASHIFFLDSDVILPPDGLIKLWNRQMPIVAGIYGSKHEAPGVWVEQAKSGQARYAAVTRETLESTPLFTHPDIVIGGGCCLIDMRVFTRLEAPYFEWTQGKKPNGVSEDFDFCEKVRKAGIPIHVDTSVRCKHVDISMLDWGGKRERLMI